jgi:hypothetical protein
MLPWLVCELDMQAPEGCHQPTAIRDANASQYQETPRMRCADQNIKTSSKTKYRPRYEGFVLAAYLRMMLFLGMFLSNAVRADPTVSNVGW